MKAGLRTKMLVPALSAIIVCMGLASYFSSRKASEEIWGELISASGNITRSVELGLSNMMEDMLAIVVLQADDDKIIRLLTPEGKEGKAKEEGVAALAATCKVSVAIQGVNLLDTKGDVLASSDPGSTGNFADRDYFKKAMSGQANISDPVLSRITGKPVILIAAPVKSEGKIVGVLYLRVDLGKFSEDMVDPVKVGQGGYAFIADKTGKIVSHPDKSQLLKLDISQFDWGKNMLSMGSGTLEYTFNGVKKTAVFSRSKLTGWIIGVTVNADDISKASSAVRNSAMLFGGAGIILVSLAIMIILHQMIGALKQCVAFAGAVAGGDLENKLSMRRSDEIGSLGDSLRVMVDKLKDMIETANMKTAEAEAQSTVARKAVAEAEEATRRAEGAKVEGMVTAANKLEGVVGVATQASESLSEEVHSCGRSAQHQSARISETATAMDQMNATIMEVARNSSEAAQTATQARHKAEEGAEIVGQVIKGIGEVETQAEELKADMGILGKQAEDIGRIMNVISDIADQTNLLALNAAIEAARAGDAGRGFAVVADEVRKLAEKTMSATKEVGEAISGIQQGTLKNVRNVERSSKTIEEATLLAGRSGESLAEIVSLVELAADQVRSIATAAEEQSSASEEITRSVEDINRISSEVSESMTQASQSVQELAGQTAVLRGLIEELKSGGDGGMKAIAPGSPAGLKRLT